MAAHPGLLAAAARRTRLGLLLTPATVQRLRQYRPAREPRPTPSPAPPCAAAIPATTCATARWPWTASWACPGGALCAADCAAVHSPRAGPRLAYATTPSRRCNAFAVPHESRPATSSDAVPPPAGTTRPSPCAGSPRSFLAGLDQLVSIGFKQSLQGTSTWLRATTSAWRHSSARASAAVVRTTSPHTANATREGPPSTWPQAATRARGLLAPRQLAVNILHMHHHEQNDSAIPALLRTPIAVFLSSPVRNESKQSYNSDDEKMEYDAHRSPENGTLTVTD